MEMPMELKVLLVTTLLVGSTWLLYRLADKLQARP